ncbi:hypothetical protein ONZ45_g2847 [Pleurotus djamor]|nr:hypothetical protein ONZ45_g2847 [Pleurotus djamor]
MMSSHSSSQTLPDDSAKLKRLLNFVGPALIAEYRDATISATLLEISEPEDYVFENAKEWVSFASLKKWYTMYLQDSKLKSLISGAPSAASSTPIPRSISSPRLPSTAPATRRDALSTPSRRLPASHPFFSTPTLPSPRQIKLEPASDESDDDDKITFVETPQMAAKRHVHSKTSDDNVFNSQQTLPAKRTYTEVIEISDSEDEEQPTPPTKKKAKKDTAKDATSAVRITRKLVVDEVKDIKSCWPVPQGECVAYLLDTSGDTQKWAMSGQKPMNMAAKLKSVIRGPAEAGSPWIQLVQGSHIYRETLKNLHIQLVYLPSLNNHGSPRPSPTIKEAEARQRASPGKLMIG